MEEGFARSFGIDAHRATLQGFSLALAHPHLPVHEHREQPVAEGGEFLVLGAVAFDEVEEGGGGLVEFVG